MSMPASVLNSSQDRKGLVPMPVVAQLSFLRVGLAVADELGNGLELFVRPDGDVVGHVDQLRHRDQVLGDVVGGLLVEVVVQRIGDAAHQKGLPIGGRTGHVGRAQHAAGAWLVFHDDGLLERLRQLLGHQPGQGVGVATRREGHHQRDRLGRPGLLSPGRCAARTQGSSCERQQAEAAPCKTAVRVEVGHGVFPGWGMKGRLGQMHGLALVARRAHAPLTSLAAVFRENAKNPLGFRSTIPQNRT